MIAARPLVLTLLAATATALSTRGGEARAQPADWCTAGRPLNILWRGSWYAGSAIGPAPGGCRIHYAGFGASDDETVGPDRAAPEGVTRSFADGGASPAPANPGARASGGAIKPGHYACTGFIGSVTGGGHMIAMPSFSISAGGKTYVHDDHSRGAVTLAGDGTATFRGGSLDGQAAKYEASSGGHAVLREYNQSRSRTVVDCQGPPN